MSHYLEFQVISMTGFFALFVRAGSMHFGCCPPKKTAEASVSRQGNSIQICKEAG